MTPGQRQAFRDRLSSPRDIDACRSVQQDDIALRVAAAILKNIAQDTGILRSISALKLAPVSPYQPEILRGYKFRLERPAAQLGNLGPSFKTDFVQAIFT